MRSFRGCLLALAVCSATTGCAMMHDMQPHRLWRWNRGPAPSSNPFFSVSDPVAELGASEDSLEAEVTSERLVSE